MNTETGQSGFPERLRERDWVPAKLDAGRNIFRALITLTSIPLWHYLASWWVTSHFEAGIGIWMFLAPISGLALLAAFGTYVVLAYPRSPTSEDFLEISRKIQPLTSFHED